jgi:predicted nucleic acid-binding protein
VILVDTSVWVDHLRRDNPRLRALLGDAAVLCHPFVIGELACGTMRNREVVLDLLTRLPAVPVAQHGEALAFIESRRLIGSGLGWVDINLLASALLGGARFWTLDRALRQAATSLGASAD